MSFSRVLEILLVFACLWAIYIGFGQWVIKKGAVWSAEAFQESGYYIACDSAGDERVVTYCRVMGGER